MTRTTRALAALVATLVAVVPAFSAPLVNPEGRWQLSSGEARFDLSLCGDGTQLCAKLSWLAEDARTPENLAYLNTMVVEGAVLATPAKWKGSVTYSGDTFDGTMTLLDSNTIKLSGCKAIACESMTLVRI